MSGSDTSNISGLKRTRFSAVLPEIKKRASGGMGSYDILSEASVEALAPDNVVLDDLEFFQNNFFEDRPQRLHLVNAPSFSKISATFVEALDQPDVVCILTGPPGNGKTIATATNFRQAACTDPDPDREYIWVNFKRQQFMKIVNNRKTISKFP
jgi:hypothetical protein